MGGRTCGCEGGRSEKWQVARGEGGERGWWERGTGGYQGVGETGTGDVSVYEARRSGRGATGVREGGREGGRLVREVGRVERCGHETSTEPETVNTASNRVHVLDAHVSASRDKTAAHVSRPKYSETAQSGWAVSVSLI